MRPERRPVLVDVAKFGELRRDLTSERLAAAKRFASWTLSGRSSAQFFSLSAFAPVLPQLRSPAPLNLLPAVVWIDGSSGESGSPYGRLMRRRESQQSPTLSVRFCQISIKGSTVDESLPPISVRRSVFPWVIVALVVFAAAASFIWMNNKIEALEAAKAPSQEPNIAEARQAVAALQQRANEIQTGQQKLTEQMSELGRRVAAEQGERKLLSDQLSSISGRVDALASSNADANSNPRQPQKNRRTK